MKLTQYVATKAEISAITSRIRERKERIEALESENDLRGLSMADAHAKCKSEDYKQRKEKIMKMYAENDTDLIKRNILSSNANVDLFEDSVKEVCAVWNKYVGKRFGEKTKEKIQSEMASALEVNRVWLSISGYHTNALTVTIYLDENYYNQASFTFGNVGTDCKEYLIDNVIQAIDAETVHLWYCKNERVSVDSVDDIRKAFAEVKRLEEALNNAIDHFNKLLPSDISHINRYYSGRHSIL